MVTYEPDISAKRYCLTPEAMFRDGDALSEPQLK